MNSKNSLDYFEIAQTLSSKLIAYDVEETTIEYASFLLTAGANAMQCSLPFYKETPEADIYYEMWHDAMTANFGPDDPWAPLEGKLKELNLGYLNQVQKAVDVIQKDPDNQEAYVDMGLLLKKPIDVYDAVNMCWFVSLNMQDTDVTEDVIPSTVPFSKALARRELYCELFSDVEDILKQLKSQEFSLLQNFYKLMFTEEIPSVEYHWWVPNSGKKIITKRFSKSEE